MRVRGGGDVGILSASRALIWLVCVTAGLLNNASAAETIIGRTEIRSPEGKLAPSCSEVAVYAMLQASGVSVPLDEVRERFAASIPEFDSSRVSIFHVRQVLDSYGTATRGTKHHSRKIRSLSVPSILYFARRSSNGSPLPEATGHYITLLGWKGDAAVVVDWNPLQHRSEHSVPESELAQLWEGEAIELARPYGSRWTWAFGAVLACGCGMIGFEWRRSRLTQLKPRASATMTALLLVCLAQGCSQPVNSAPPGPPTLAFESPVLRFPEVVGRQALECVFPFQVWNQMPVKIKSIVRSCSCTSSNDNLVGQVLEPGSNHQLKFSVSPVSPSQEATVVTMEVITEPPSSTPLMLAVQYTRKNVPILSHSELHVETVPGQRSTGIVTATYKRKRQTAPLRLLPERSSGKNVSLSTEPLVTEKVDGLDNVVDTLPIHLTLPAIDHYGESRAQVNLVFMDGTEISLTAIVRATHPFQPRVKTAFCGRLLPSQSWSISIPFDKRSASAPDVAKMQFSTPIVTATWQPDGSLMVTGSAPVKPGRFTSTIHMTFSDSKIPALDLPVWGIVDPQLRPSVK